MRSLQFFTFFLLSILACVTFAGAVPASSAANTLSDVITDMRAQISVVFHDIMESADNSTVEEYRPEIDEIKKLFRNATQKIQGGGNVNLGGKSISDTGDEFQRLTNDTADIFNYVLGHAPDDEFDPAIKLCAEVFKPVGSFLHICVQKVTGLSDVLKEKLKAFVDLGKNLGADISSDLNP